MMALRSHVTRRMSVVRQGLYALPWLLVPGRRPLRAAAGDRGRDEPGKDGRG